MPNTFQEVRFPIQECWAEVGGGRMRYLRAGAGPRLLLVHGLMGYSFSWRRNVPVLARHATVYAPDLLGIGFSDRPAGLDCSMPRSAERLLRFLDAAGIDTADVVGTSHGGALVITMAALAPERVRRLVLVAPVNPWSSHGRWIMRAVSTSWGAAAFRCIAPLRLGHKYFLRRLYGDPRRIPPGTLEGYEAPLARPGTVEYLLGVARCWHRDVTGLEAALVRIAHIPTLLVWGSKDAAVYPHSAARLRQCFSNAELVMLEGVGHLPYEELPEQFNRALIEFLRPGSN